VDGRKYKIKFTVTLDYKALLLLLNKKNDEDFTLGGKGYNVECCAYCDAIRVNNISKYSMHILVIVLNITIIDFCHSY